MTVNGLMDLYRHMEWADATVWTAVLDAQAGRGDATLRASLYHLHVVQSAFMRAWRGEARETPYPTFVDSEALMNWARTCYDGANDYVASLTDEAASQAMPLAWAERVAQLLGRSAATTTLGDTVLQVPMHSQYHRGQINARLREIGGTPPLVDYIAWVWFGRPGAAWPSAAGNERS